MTDSTPPGHNGPHGASLLPRVRVDSYNLELRHKDGFIGDRASKRAFAEIFQDWRERFARVDEDPFGDEQEFRKRSWTKR